MRRNLLLAALMLTVCSSCLTPKHSIRVDIDGWNDDDIKVVMIKNGEELADTIRAEKGVITFDLTPNDTIQIMRLTRLEDLCCNRLALETKSVEFDLYGDEAVEINGEIKDGILRYSNSQYKDFREEREKYLRYDISADSLNCLIEVATDFDSPEVAKLFEQRLENYEAIRAVKLDYIKSNPNSDLAAYETAKVNITMFREYYESLSDKQRSGKYKLQYDKRLKRVEDYEKNIAARQNIVVGKVAPDFTLPDLAGVEKSLSDFRGKWVILDFWGSWCGWCIKGFPELKELYKNYKGELEIIGIACNDKEDDWHKSVEENELDWLQLFNNSDVSSTYGISGFPTKILISPDGEIAMITVGSDDNFNDEVIEKISEK